MDEAFERVAGEAMNLPLAERAELVERLLSSLERRRDNYIEAAWAEEAEARIRAMDRGEAGSVDGDEVLRRVQSRRKP